MFRQEQVTLRRPCGIFGGTRSLFVVRVFFVLSRRVEGENGPGFQFAKQENQPRPDFSFGDGIHLIVTEIERIHLLDANDICRCAHLDRIPVAGLTGVQVIGILLVVGHANEVGGIAVLDQPGDGSTGKESEIVGVRRNHNHGASVEGLCLCAHDACRGGYGSGKKIPPSDPLHNGSR